MKVLIVGGGDSLYFLCKNFMAKGHEVVVVDRNRQECVELSRKLKAVVVWGDGSDPEVLEEAGAMVADIVLAITPRDQDNLVVCQLSSLRFGVPRTLALANDPDNVEVFEKLNVSSFSTVQILGSLIEQRASVEEITNLLPVGQGRVIVTEIVLEADSPAAGKCFKDIELPENALVAIVIRDNLPIVPRGGNDLLAGDRLVLITLPENHGPALKVFTGE
jgi:trk system potassium uptake protein TrkA